jgi:hypothetical protein
MKTGVFRVRGEFQILDWGEAVAGERYYFCPAYYMENHDFLVTGPYLLLNPKTRLVRDKKGQDRQMHNTYPMKFLRAL